MSLRLARAVLIIGALLGSANPAHAQTPVSVQPLAIEPRSGGADTPFRLKLPEGAECQGDSANDGYRVNTYLVPASVDPIDVVYDGLGPTPWSLEAGAAFRQPLFALDTTSIAALQTAEADAPGLPGRILDLPEFSFGVYQPADVPAGAYRIGVTCTLLNEITRVWDAEIEIEVDDAISWRSTATASSDESSEDAPIAAVLGGLAAVVTVVVLSSRRRGRATTPLEGS